MYQIVLNVSNDWNVRCALETARQLMNVSSVITSLTAKKWHMSNNMLIMLTDLIILTTIHNVTLVQLRLRT